MENWIKIPNEEELIAAGMIQKDVGHMVWCYPTHDQSWIPVQCTGLWVAYTQHWTTNYYMEMEGYTTNIKKEPLIREYKTRNDIQSGVHIWRTI
jgi:hypothetical protein